MSAHQTDAAADPAATAGAAAYPRTRLFRIPAFTAGLFVMLAFSAGVQGFFLIFAVWIQIGMGYSPLAAGLTALAFSAGSFLLASAAVPLAQRYGRYVLCGGGLLLAAGTGAIQLGAGHVGTGTDPWPVVPGLVLAGAGLSLLVIPLANVVLAAVPSQAAGGAGGLFSTAQQLGGALGVAVIGTIFSGQLGTRSFTQAFTHRGRRARLTGQFGSRPEEAQVPASVLYMSMSLDGYIAGPDDEPGNPGGDGFGRLHEWYGDFSRPSGPAGELHDELEATGAVLAGRRTVEQVDHWGGDNGGRPIFVLSHRPPDPSVAKYPLVTYVTDGIASAMAQAKAAAGDHDVCVLGAYTAQRALEAGVLDEFQIHQIPVLFGAGRRLFEMLPSPVELEIIRVIDTPEATHIRYRVRR